VIQIIPTEYSPIELKGTAMIIMYRGFELVPVKVGEGWKVHIHSGGKPVAATMLIATEESALAEAKMIADDFRAGRR
jgi:hypothetical protein